MLWSKGGRPGSEREERSIVLFPMITLEVRPSAGGKLVASESKTESRVFITELSDSPLRSSEDYRY